MFPDGVTSSGAQGTLTNLSVQVGTSCPLGVPQMEMNETYQLIVSPDNSQAVITAQEVWGALRGLETFSHLVFNSAPNTYQVRSANVVDHPRFPHRGILLDTARHFLPVGMILRNLDLMAQNKFNVFHWHIVDTEAFPYESVAFPDLSKKGAYTPNHVYHQADIKRVIAYARLRGIRVIVEFDTPGHMGSWGLGQPGLLSDCFYDNKTVNPLKNIVDPTKNETWSFLTTLFNEILSVFPDNYIHMGGDEVLENVKTCWLNNPQVQNYMNQKGYGTDYTQLENEYFNKLLNMVQGARNNTKVVVWQEVLDNNVNAPGAIAHVWKGNTSTEMMEEMANVTKAGHYAILSSCWYLNYIKYGNDWGYINNSWVRERGMYYQCDPTGFDGTDQQKSLVLGGEAVMWAEFVDATNLIPRLWPRASAAGERLWSDPAQTTSADLAWPRLHEFRCRMLRRGYPVEPPNLPSYCPQPWDPDYDFDDVSNTMSTTTPSGAAALVASSLLSISNAVILFLAVRLC
uniref:Beta-hexosaminidase n=1 Tax=Plectus sambesii TaxID=2011161 RepID=A0A914WR50_9BILA